VKMLQGLLGIHRIELRCLRTRTLYQFFTGRSPPARHCVSAEVVNIIMPWLGRLRNIREMAIAGLGEEQAEELQTRWRSEEPLENTELTEMYLYLERRFGGMSRYRASRGRRLGRPRER